MSLLAVIWLVGTLVTWRSFTGAIAWWLENDSRPGLGTWMFGVIAGLAIAAFWWVVVPIIVLAKIMPVLKFLSIGVERDRWKDDRQARVAQQLREAQAENRRLQQLADDFDSGKI